MSSDTQKQADAPGKAKVSIWQVIQSVLAAGFGVQSQAARERDFTRGRPIHYIVAGTIGTILFILTLVIIVRVVLSAAGA